MYLKAIEMIGFKSFGQRTKLEFERGLTAIVGPNGCGKSNVSDAVRWVLGEQSAKALRGAKMEDCIFSGTDKRKAMGMAEVSLTLSDCDQALGTDFHEVTVTRRVFRSGEGHYFINKTACRLKDIHRLFMDTGVGRNAYSLMEQGRIDLILSSRPEDRRVVFEEASGITKFKADRKEALRKLDHTEANLLRLADIVREVKRQIISLQRQAGKARRYQALHTKLRDVEVYFTQIRIKEYRHSLEKIDQEISLLLEQEDRIRNAITGTEEETSIHQHGLHDLEQLISEAMEASVQTKSEWSRVHDLIRVSHDRILEQKHLSEREEKDAARAKEDLQTLGESLASVNQSLSDATNEKAKTEEQLDELTKALQESEQASAELSHRLTELRDGSMTLESKLARLQNEFSELEAKERSTILRKERLIAERSELNRAKRNL